MLSEQSSFSPYLPAAGHLSPQASVDFEQTSSIDHHRDAERPSRQASVDFEQTSIDYHRDARVTLVRRLSTSSSKPPVGAVGKKEWVLQWLVQWVERVDEGRC